MASLTLRRDECDDLPDTCMVCGEPATDSKTKTFNWTPSWVIVIVLLSLLIGLIVLLILQKKMTVVIPLCDRHRANWRTRTRVLFGTLGLSVAAFLVGIGLAANDIKAGGPVAVVSFLVGILGTLFLAVVFQQVSVRATEITDSDITLAGVGPDFIDAVRGERKGRRREERGGDEDDEVEYEERLRRQRRLRDRDDD